MWWSTTTLGWSDPSSGRARYPSISSPPCPASVIVCATMPSVTPPALRISTPPVRACLERDPSSVLAAGSGVRAPDPAARTIGGLDPDAREPAGGGPLLVVDLLGPLRRPAEQPLGVGDGGGQHVAEGGVRIGDAGGRHPGHRVAHRVGGGVAAEPAAGGPDVLGEPAGPLGGG